MLGLDPEKDEKKERRTTASQGDLLDIYRLEFDSSSSHLHEKGKNVVQSRKGGNDCDLV